MCSRKHCGAEPGSRLPNSFFGCTVLLQAPATSWTWAQRWALGEAGNHLCPHKSRKPAATRNQSFCFATSVMLTFIFFLAGRGHRAFGSGVVGVLRGRRDAEKVIGKSAPWFVLAVMLLPSYAVRAIYIEVERHVCAWRRLSRGKAGHVAGHWPSSPFQRCCFRLHPDRPYQLLLPPANMSRAF